MLIGVQGALFAGEEVMSQEPDSKKNNTENKGSHSHGETLYSSRMTIGKDKDTENVPH